MVDDGVVNKVIALIDCAVMQVIGTEELEELLQYHFRLVTLIDLLKLMPMTELQAKRMADRFAKHVGFLRARELASADLVSPTIQDLSTRLQAGVNAVEARHDPELGGGSAYVVLCLSMQDRYTALHFTSSSALEEIDLVCEPLLTHVEILKGTTGPTSSTESLYNWVRIKRAQLLLNHPHAKKLRDILHEIEMELSSKLKTRSG